MKQRALKRCSEIYKDAFSLYQLATLPAGGFINNSLSDADICDSDTAQCNAPTSHVMTNE